MADADADDDAADDAAKPLPPPLPPAALRDRVYDLKASSNPTKASVTEARAQARDNVGLVDDSFKNIMQSRFGAPGHLNYVASPSKSP